ncbi:MAG: PAS domain-containing protein, partial [Planctomycetes bacterium]|nr:PAS domain-containing protein [Planctomycetota bacterium]
MSISTIVWSMISSACLTLAVVNLSFRGFQRKTWGQHLLALSATAASAFVICELLMMHSSTPAEYGAALRWAQIPSSVVILCMVGFIRLHLRAGRRWIAILICSLRCVGLVANFLVGENLTFLSVTHLKVVSLLGEPTVTGVGVNNPWTIFGQGSLLLFAVFAADATVTVWRRGDRRQALPSCGGIALLSLAALLLAVPVAWGLIDWPLTVAPFFLGVVAAMGFGVSREAARAVGLTSELRESEERAALAAEAAEIGVWEWIVTEDRVWGSARWRRMFGFPADDDLDFGTVMSRIHPEDHGRIERGLRSATRDRTDFVDEFRLKRPDGSQRLVVTRCRVIAADRGKPVRVVGAMLDVTERRQSETEIRLQRAQLAHLSRVNMLGELAGSLAHELSQPLTAILGNAQAAQRFLERGEPDVGEVRDALADIVAENVRAGEIIHRLR